MFIVATGALYLYGRTRGCGIFETVHDRCIAVAQEILKKVWIWV